jgi:hypothetical protein
VHVLAPESPFKSAPAGGVPLIFVLSRLQSPQTAPVHGPKPLFCDNHPKVCRPEFIRLYTIFRIFRTNPRNTSPSRGLCFCLNLSTFSTSSRSFFRSSLMLAHWTNGRRFHPTATCSQRLGREECQPHGLTGAGFTRLGTAFREEG